MQLLYELTAMPAWISGLLVVGTSVTAALLGLVYVRGKVGLEKLILNNEVGGFKYATLGVVYAVLLAFIVSGVWDDFKAAEAAVGREADALMALHLLSVGFSAEETGVLRKGLRGYVETVLGEEWLAMSRGESSPAADAALHKLAVTYVDIEPQTEREWELYGRSLEWLDILGVSREQRIASANGSIPGLMWFVIFIGAGVTIGFTMFFGAPNIFAQAMMTGASALVLMLVLFLAISLNHPFTGDVSVTPARLGKVLKIITSG